MFRQGDLITLGRLEEYQSSIRVIVLEFYLGIVYVERATLN